MKFIRVREVGGLDALVLKADVRRIHDRGALRWITLTDGICVEVEDTLDDIQKMLDGEPDATKESANPENRTPANLIADPKKPISAKALVYRLRAREREVIALRDALTDLLTDIKTTFENGPDEWHSVRNAEIILFGRTMI